MKHEISAESAYLRVDVFDPPLGPEGDHFLRQVAAECRKHGQTRILVVSRSPHPVSVCAYYTLIKFAEALNVEADHTIALVDEAHEVTRLNEFAKTVAQPETLNVMAFADRPTAVNWLLEDRRQHARRVANEPA